MGPRRLRRLGIGTALVVVAASVAGFLSRGAAATAAAIAPPVNCDLTQYQPVTGLTAVAERDGLAVTWEGQNGSELRARYAIDCGQPVIRELAVRKAAGAWSPLGQNLTPEYHVVSGVRRMTTQQGQPLEGLGVELTPEVIEKNRWYAFWDAPLVMPAPPPAAGVDGRGRAAGPSGGVGRVYGAPRDPKEIRRASASFSTGACSVKTDGAQPRGDVPRIVDGHLHGRPAVHRLSRHEPAAHGCDRQDRRAMGRLQVRRRPERALDALLPRVTWRDTGGNAQQYQFGGVVNEHRVTVRAKNRVLVAEGKGGSLAAFTPPHVFFFTREVDTNLGYVWYRKDGEAMSASAFVRPTREESRSTSRTSRSTTRLLARCRRMGVYFYASPDAAEPTRQAVLAFTHDDDFKPIAGYKTIVNHFHLGFTERQRASGSLDTPFQDLMAMRAAASTSSA